MNLFTNLIALTLTFLNRVRDRVLQRHRRSYTAHQAGRHTLDPVLQTTALLLAIFVLGAIVYRIFFA